VALLFFVLILRNGNIINAQMFDTLQMFIVMVGLSVSVLIWRAKNRSNKSPQKTETSKVMASTSIEVSVVVLAT
jgi:hypothetical protein